MEEKLIAVGSKQIQDQINKSTFIGAEKPSFRTIIDVNKKDSNIDIRSAFPFVLFKT
jgi:hypothetical protein